MHETLVYNRQTAQLEPEPFFGQKATVFFHESHIGFFLMETILRWRWISELQTIYYHKRRSKKDIQPFIEKYKVDIAELQDEVTSFNSFNDFFVRKLKPEARPIDSDPKKLISPADARLFVYKINQDLIVPVKGVSFTLKQLTRDQEIAKFFEGGLCLIFRLAPIDYHRFCYVDDVSYQSHITINGCYRSVNPISLGKNKPVFTENQRQYCLMQSANFGPILHIDVGAIGVGRIIQHHLRGGSFVKGQEKGYFEFGGSTSILLLKEGSVRLDSDLLEQSSSGYETLVRYGEAIGSI
ncbi:MAG: archaetidylserine decarboxylase [Verrucomicrobiota bacterium]